MYHHILQNTPALIHKDGNLFTVTDSRLWSFCKCLQAATGEDVSAEDLGGAQLHCSTSGVTDHLAESEEHAISIARSIVGNLSSAGQPGPEHTAAQRSMPWDEPLHPSEELRGADRCHYVAQASRNPTSSMPVSVAGLCLRHLAGTCYWLARM